MNTKTLCYPPTADCSPACSDHLDENSCSCKNSDFPNKWAKPTCSGISISILLLICLSINLVIVLLKKIKLFSYFMNQMRNFLPMCHQILKKQLKKTDSPKMLDFSEKVVVKHPINVAARTREWMMIVGTFAQMDRAT